MSDIRRNSVHKSIDHGFTALSLPILFMMISIVAVFVSCKEETTASPAPRNLISGVVDGQSFSNTGVLAIKDTNDVFLLAARAGNGNSILATWLGKEEMEYPAGEEGSLQALIEYLNALIEADSFFIDSTALQEIFSDSAQLIPPGNSYLFYLTPGQPYFSRRGSIYLTSYDGTINRIYGDLEMELDNAVSGPVYLHAKFEDVFYIDCPDLSDCSY